GLQEGARVGEAFSRAAAQPTGHGPDGRAVLLSTGRLPERCGVDAEGDSAGRTRREGAGRELAADRLELAFQVGAAEQGGRGAGAEADRSLLPLRRVLGEPARHLSAQELERRPHQSWLLPADGAC